MDVTRRNFGQVLTGTMLTGTMLSSTTLSAAPSLLLPAFATADEVVERRVYDRAGAVPPASIMRRCGIELVSFENAGSDVVLTVSFPSFAKRVRAWDCFNSDPEWCALREGHEVRLREIAILRRGPDR